MPLAVLAAACRRKAAHSPSGMRTVRSAVGRTSYAPTPPPTPPPTALGGAGRGANKDAGYTAGGHGAEQQLVDGAVLPLVHPRPPRELAVVEPRALPAARAREELEREALRVLEAAENAHVHVRLQDGAAVRRPREADARRVRRLAAVRDVHPHARVARQPRPSGA